MENMKNEPLVNIPYEGVNYSLTPGEVRMLNKILEFEGLNIDQIHGSKVKLLFFLKDGKTVTGTILECIKCNLYDINGIDGYIPYVLKIKTTEGSEVLKFFQIDSFRDENNPFIIYNAF